MIQIKLNNIYYQEYNFYMKKFIVMKLELEQKC